LIRSLRKGSTTIEYWHKFGSDTVQAVKTEIELKTDHAVFRTTLKPNGGNQKLDADRVFGGNVESITEVTFSDSQIRDVTAKFLNSYKAKIGYIKLEINYNHSHIFETGLKPFDDDGLSFKIKT
jgi:C-terminal processing protease CtpA/Prc